MQWFYLNGRHKHGPISASELGELLAQGALDLDNLVWTEGFAHWRRLGDVQEFSRRAQDIERSQGITAAPVNPRSQAIARSRAAAKAREADIQWFYLKGRSKYGPLSFSETLDCIRQGELLPDHLVWRTGFSHWCKAQELPELFPAANPTAE